MAIREGDGRIKVPVREQYEPMRIAVLGSLEELTLGNKPHAGHDGGTNST